MSRKKIVIITSVSILTLFLLFLLWLFFLKKDTEAPIQPLDDLGVTTLSGFTPSPVKPTSPATLLPPGEDPTIQNIDPLIPNIQTQQPPDIARLTKIFNGPTAGFFVPNGNDPIIVFKQGGGERYEIEKETYIIKKIESPDIPKTVRAFPLTQNSFVIQQQDSVTPTLRNTIFFNNYTPGSKGVLIGSNITITPHLSGNGFLYTRETNRGIEIKSILLARTTPFSFNNPFLSWSSRWNNSAPTLLTRPHNGIDGFFYSLERDGTLSKHLGPLKGLSAQFEEKTNTVLFSTNNHLSLQTFIQKRGANRIPLERKTLAEKCTLTPETVLCGVPQEVSKTSLPESWYQGRVSFDDEIVEFYPESGRIKRVFENKTGETLDIIEGVIVESLFVFLNKKDLSLWALQLKNPSIE